MYMNYTFTKISLAPAIV